VTLPDLPPLIPAGPAPARHGPPLAAVGGADGHPLTIAVRCSTSLPWLSPIRDRAEELLQHRAIILGEEHGRPEARAIICELLLTQRVSRLFLELGDVPISSGLLMGSYLNANRCRPVDTLEHWGACRATLNTFDATNPITFVDLVRRAVERGVEVYFFDGIGGGSARQMANRDRFMAREFLQHASVGSVLLNGADHFGVSFPGVAPLPVLCGIQPDHVFDVPRIGRRVATRAHVAGAVPALPMPIADLIAQYAT